MNELFVKTIIGFLIVWAVSKIVFGVYFHCRKAYIISVINDIENIKNDRYKICEETIQTAQRKL